MPKFGACTPVGPFLPSRLRHLRHVCQGEVFLWPMGCKIKFHPEFRRDFTLLYPGGLGCHGPARGTWSIRPWALEQGRSGGKPLLRPRAGTGQANAGCARLGWGRSLFLEALETSREGTAFSFPSFTDRVILIRYVFVRGFSFFFSHDYYLFTSCLLFMASEKGSRNAADAERKLRTRLFGGAKSSQATNTVGM